MKVVKYRKLCKKKSNSAGAIPYTLYLIPYTLYLIPYTLYLIPYTLYLIPYTLYLIPYTLLLRSWLLVAFSEIGIRYSRGLRYRNLRVWQAERGMAKQHL
ncbi:hypothetical protein K3G39_09715 [Pontibacter sp. HSC-14F20]|uniref:hypothetical protein n=1 Tax=Pontibacter sp. HSC-14F20 TaxID=2864136 RepID=UPI001C739957|nr:hypothetical protein [Pontibacter sp. HSC-14F20]MBX0333515.1 hypothetical protein [Pontibacter sp. HSC-14F20]